MTDVNFCRLDLLPVEMLYEIFDRLSAIDIICGLSKVSPYMNDVVLGYKFYKINLKSILKSEFDLICNTINGYQIKYLTLSDDDDTPNQSNLFLSLFNMEEFSLNLNGLSLIKINNESMKLILNNLDKLNNLSSLTINGGYIHSSMLKNVLPKLNRLNILSTSLFKNLIQMNKLKHLIISYQCSFNQLEIIRQYAPNLISLNVSLHGENEGQIGGIYSNLTQLVLNIPSTQFSRLSSKEFNKINFLKLISLI